MYQIDIPLDGLAGQWNHKRDAVEWAQDGYECTILPAVSPRYGARLRVRHAVESALEHFLAEANVDDNYLPLKIKPSVYTVRADVIAPHNKLWTLGLALRGISLLVLVIAADSPNGCALAELSCANREVLEAWLIENGYDLDAHPIY